MVAGLLISSKAKMLSKQGTIPLPVPLALDSAQQSAERAQAPARLIVGILIYGIFI